MVKFGIRAQLMAGIAAITVAAIGLIGFIGIKIFEGRALYWKADEAEKAVRFIRVVLRSEGEEKAGVFVDKALKEIGVTEFRLTGEGGVLASGTLPEDTGTVLSFYDGITVSKMGGGLLRGPARALYVKAAFGARGSLEFTVPLGEINEDIAGVGRFLLLYAVADSVIIIVLGFYILSRSIITPVAKLKEAAIRIASGEFGERASLGGRDEIGSLAASFNTMAERLESEIKALDRVNRELVTAQEELLRTRTLAAVGRLAAGIAHEIGNPLGAAGGYLEILSGGVADKNEEKEIFGRALKEVSRIDSIVREFLELSRPAKRPASPVDVNAVLQDLLSSIDLRADFKDISVRTRLSEGLPPVMVDEGKLRQVFLNLIVNAAQAMAGEERKELTVETSAELRDTELRTRRRRTDRPIAPGEGKREYVTVRFSDTGPGISEEDGEKIFEPFFTTKEVGRGTGLGLFVSRSIMETYGGEIGFVSREGQGSTFVVTLPSGRS